LSIYTWSSISQYQLHPIHYKYIYITVTLYSSGLISPGAALLSEIRPGLGQIRPGWGKICPRLGQLVSRLMFVGGGGLLSMNGFWKNISRIRNSLNFKQSNLIFFNNDLNFFWAFKKNWIKVDGT